MFICMTIFKNMYDTTAFKTSIDKNIYVFKSSSITIFTSHTSDDP